MARHTLQPISELTLEKINDDTVIPHPPYPPLLLACNLLWQLLQLRLVFGRRHPWWLVEDPVKIFVDPIKQKAQELLGVVLI
jgi:hypothetical protein